MKNHLRKEEPMVANSQESQEKPSFLVDRSAAWRAHPAFPRQHVLLDKLGLPHTQEMTAGQASDLLSKAMAQQKRRRGHEPA
jgi:hypothetical protein